MKVRLLSPHAIDDRVYLTHTELVVALVSPLMEGLDEEAIVAIKEEKIRVFGRWIGQYPNFRLLEDPPIERPLDNNRPVPPVGSSGGPK